VFFCHLAVPVAIEDFSGSFLSEPNSFFPFLGYVFFFRPLNPSLLPIGAYSYGLRPSLQPPRRRFIVCDRRSPRLHEAHRDRLLFEGGFEGRLL